MVKLVITSIYLKNYPWCTLHQSPLTFPQTTTTFLLMITYFLMAFIIINYVNEGYNLYNLYNYITYITISLSRDIL